MKQINCPLNGLRDIDEFICGGEVREMPDTERCSDREWAEYLFMMDNHAGTVREWWLHSPSGYWFIAERHTVTDVISATYDPSSLFAREALQERGSFDD